jgi:hypothetical protein
MYNHIYSSQIVRVVERHHALFAMLVRSMDIIKQIR